MQGQETNIIKFKDTLTAFLEKLKNWISKSEAGNWAMFERVSECLKNDFDFDDDTKECIVSHLKSLQSEIERYFPDIHDGHIVAQNPFSPGITMSIIPDDLQDEFIDLKNDSEARNFFLETTLPKFWCKMSKKYKKLSKFALSVLVPFASTYLCESGFSTLVLIKTKMRNKLDVADDMRLALSKTEPDIIKLTNELQAQPSH